MGQIRCIHIDTNKIMKLTDMVIVNYQGVILGIGKGRKNKQLGDINETDYLHCYVDNEKETDKNLSKAYEFLSCLSFRNRAIIVSIDGGGRGCNGFDLQRFKKRICSLAWGRSIFPNSGDLEISCIPNIDPENTNQAITLSLYREAMNARSNFYKFLCLWKVLDLKFNKKEFKNIKNETLKKYRDKLINKNDIKYWGMDKGDLWKHLDDDYRNAIAHITRKPALITDDSKHLLTVTRGVRFLEAIIDKFVEDEYNLREKRCLVLMPNETLPRYVTIEERLIQKDKYDKSLFDNYMKNEHKPHHNFADKEYNNI